MYGKESGLQTGIVALSGAHIQANGVTADHDGFKFYLHKQIKVSPLPSENPLPSANLELSPFAKQGDSGATIFLDLGNNPNCGSTPINPSPVSPQNYPNQVSSPNNLNPASSPKLSKSSVVTKLSKSSGISHLSKFSVITELCKSSVVSE